MAGKPISLSKRKLERQAPLDDKLAAWARRKESTGVAWQHVPGRLLKAVLHVCVREGVSLTIAPTRDGGAVAVRLWAGGEERKEYAANHEELCLLLERVLEVLETGAEDVLASMTES